jgi:hypothetical protein
MFISFYVEGSIGEGSKMQIDANASYKECNVKSKKSQLGEIDANVKIIFVLKRSF